MGTDDGDSGKGIVAGALDVEDGGIVGISRTCQANAGCLTGCRINLSMNGLNGQWNWPWMIEAQ